MPTITTTPHKNSLDEVSRLKYELQSTRLSVEELQDAITVERQQCLSWMEKHNKVTFAFIYRNYYTNKITRPRLNVFSILLLLF